MKKLILLLLLSVLTRVSLYAQTGGAEITYRCLDAAGNYEITLDYYKSCKAAAFCAGSNCNALSSCVKIIEVYGGDPNNMGTRFFTTNVFGVSVRDVVFHPQCKEKSECDNMGCVTPGNVKLTYEKYTFKGTVNIGPAALIPAAACNIRFVYRECCRSISINSFNAQNTDYYTDAVVNRCASTYPNCNSPYFANDPEFVALTGKVSNINFGAFDPDMDSLVYSFTPSMSDYNVPVTYITPYQYDVPMPVNIIGGYPNGIACNSATGNIYFRPNITSFVGTLAVRVDQYRRINNNPTFVGSVKRDVQITVMDLGANNTPTFTTIPAGIPASQPKTSYEVCAGSTICFDVIAKDTDIADTTYLTWSKSLEKYGATFLPVYNGPRDSTGPREDRYRFCWTPPDSVGFRANGQSYTFTITGEDNRCSYSTSFTRAFSIKVFPRASVKIRKDMLDCNKFTLTYLKDSSIIPIQNFSQVRWRIAKAPEDYSFTNGFNQFNNIVTTPSLRFLTKGRYLVELYVEMNNSSSTPCGISYYDTIDIKQALDIRTTADTAVCRLGAPMQIAVVKTDTAINNYQWYKIPDTSSILVTNTSFNVNPNKSVAYLLRAIDTETGCQYSDTTIINVAALNVKFSVSKNAQCLKGNLFVFTNQTVDTSLNPLIHNWTFSNGDTSTAAVSFSKSFTTVGAYSIKLVESTAFGCKDSASASLNVFVSPTVKFVFNTDTAQCQKISSYSVTNQSTASGDGMVYTWDFGNGNTSNATNPPAFTYSSFGLKNVKLIATTTSHACTDSLIKQVWLFPSPTAQFIINNTSQCEKGNQFIFTNQSSISAGSLSAIWNFGNNASTQFYSPTYAYPAAGDYTVKLKVVSAAGCADSLSKSVSVLSSPFASFAINGTQHCTGDEVVLTNTTTNSSGTFNSFWDNGAGDIRTTKDANYIYTNAGDYTIKLRVESGLCKDSITQAITINPTPEKPIITGDTLATKHTSKTYAVIDNGNQFNWMITGDSSHSISGASVIVRWGPSDGGTVSVSQKNSAGCESDTAKLNVKVIPKIGLSEISNDIFNVYPQPASDKLLLKGDLTSIQNVEMIDVQGKVQISLLSEEIINSEISLTNINSGIYLLRITMNNGNEWYKKVSVMK